MYGITHYRAPASLQGWAVMPFAIWSGRVAIRAGHCPLVAADGIMFALSLLWYVLRLGTVAGYAGQRLPGQLLTGAAIGLALPSLAGLRRPEPDPATGGRWARP